MASGQISRSAVCRRLPCQTNATQGNAPANRPKHKPIGAAPVNAVRQINTIPAKSNETVTTAETVRCAIPLRAMSCWGFVGAGCTGLAFLGQQDHQIANNPVPKRSPKMTLTRSHQEHHEYLPLPPQMSDCSCAR